MQYVLLANSKGVVGDFESERSWRQILKLTTAGYRIDKWYEPETTAGVQPYKIQMHWSADEPSQGK